VSAPTTSEAHPAARYVGTNARKKDGDRFLTGRMTYIDDVVRPGMAHATVLRSPYAHARIRSVDVSGALEVTGVIAAMDGQEAARHSGPIPHFIDPQVFGGNTTEVRCLAMDKVVYAGQPVAAVVAETRHDAEAALDAIRVEYEPLPGYLDADAAMAEDATAIYDGWESNLVIAIPFADGDTDAALEAAPFRIADELTIQRYSTQPIEPRGYVAEWDALNDRLTFYGACQNPHPLRWVLANALQVEESDVHVIAPTVGGGFGLKMHGHPEEALVCVLSKIAGRPVKWIEDRSETLLIGGREHVHRFEVGFTDDGTITAFRDHFVANVGALGAAPGWGMAFLTGLGFPTGYRVPNTDVLATIVATNKGPWNASRGYGKEATNLVMERVIDLVARRLRMDPLEVRRRNLIPPDAFPFKMNSGLNVDSGDYHALLDQAADLIGLEDVRAKQTRLREEGRYLGVGFAFELTPEAADIPGTMVGGFDTTTVRMNPSGKVTILTGVTTPGGGNDTGIAQIVADELGVALDDVSVVQGDTDLCPYGFGNYSGRSMVVGGNSALLAARDVADKLRKVAAVLLEVDAGEVDLRGGFARHAPSHEPGVVADASQPEKAIPLKDVSYAIYTLAFAVATSVEPPLESTRTYKPDNISHLPDEKGRIQPYPTYSNAVHVAVVEVDAETGKVEVRRIGVAHDCGTMINPRFVEGQMEGAVVMGVGAALMEDQRYDDEGHLLSDRFKTYLMPRAADVPSIEMVHQVTPSPYTILGTKGAGEAGVGGAQAAIANAVHDALAPLGVTIRSMPLTAPTVLHAIVHRDEETPA
jgi:aerobic carbon-monoxide dehydrogenase large subunit